MVITPDLDNLAYEFQNGIKFFEIIAQPVEHEILPGIFIKGWGYNGTIPGPSIQVYQGDNVNIRVKNNLPEATSVHWHGLDVPNMMDGVPEVEPSPKIEPGSYFDYKFTVTNPPGTHMYHAHVDSVKQQMMGLGGAFIILDQKSKIRHDYFYMLQEFKLIGLETGEIKQGHYEIDYASMDFNFFTMNGRCFPFASTLNVKLGEYVRIRMGNIMHDAHPMHIHGHQFLITAGDGNMVRPENRLKKNTVNIASGETYDILFKADNPGRWPFHCHIPHHMSNNMTKPLGGMMTVIAIK